MRSRDDRYLLRVWREDARDGGVRASVRPLRGGEERTFRDLEALLAFLRRDDPRDGPPTG